MEIEWATICGAATESGEGHVDLLAVNASGVLVPDVAAELPFPVPITLALCILASVEDAAAGGTLTAQIGVLDPDGAPAGGTKLIWVFERGRRIDVAGHPARRIVPVRFAFEAKVAGGYSIGILMEGQEAIWLPYYVGDVADVTG